MSDKCCIAVVLDRSGSMSGCQDATIKGFNDFLKDQKSAPGEATFTLVQFDDQYEVVHNNINIQDVPNLTTQTFCPRGSTALLDAIGRTVNTTRNNIEKMAEDERPNKVLFAIITDGQENVSKEYDRTAVFKMVEDLKEKGWQFAFIGANQDAIQTASGFSVQAGAALNYQANDDGTQVMFNTLSCSTLKYRTMAPDKLGADYCFFNPDAQPAKDIDLSSDPLATVNSLRSGNV
jgi:uncharacterized protein YegL